MQLPNFDQFKEKSKDHNIIGLTVPLMFDAGSSITLADRFVESDYFYLLESAFSGPHHMARYSFIGVDALLAYGWSSDVGLKIETTEVCDLSEILGQKNASDSQTNSVEFVRQFRGLTQHCKMSHVVGESPFNADENLLSLGGFLTLWGYDLSTAIEPSVLATAPDKTLEKQIGLPDFHCLLAKNHIVMDHLHRRLWVTRHVYINPDDKSPEKTEELYQLECRQLKHFIGKLEASHMPKTFKIQNSPLDYSKFTSVVDENQFLANAKACGEEIRDGEIFQIQIGNRLSTKTDAHPFDVFRHLRCLNPSPYMFFNKIQGHYVFGASPEMMVGVEGSTITHRPIAGTRGRTWNKTKDLARKQELIESEKERAEHVMLVDLSRNDIGRISKPGTVKVTDLMVVEEYSHVLHMVSEVQGELRDEFDAIDAMVYSFPNGTVTGAPKIRSMQIIRQFENISREFYAGSIGMFDFSGGLKSTLLIRTLHYKDGTLSTQASAGIVYDSIGEHEWKETQHKMKACLLVMQNTI